MNHSPASRIQEAWRQASDYEVAGALTRLDEYADHVAEIILTEAQRRGIRPEDARSLAPPRTFQPLRNVMGALVRFITHHRLISSVFLGFVTLLTLTRPATEAAAAVYTGILLPICWVCLGSLSWPLRKYALVAGVTAAFASGIIVPIIAIFVVGPRLYSAGSLSGIRWAGYLITFVLIWLVTAVPLCAAVFWRNRYRPVYPPGHCAKCGYNLRGLLERRCPECGTPFASAPEHA